MPLGWRTSYPAKHKIQPIILPIEVHPRPIAYSLHDVEDRIPQLLSYSYNIYATMLHIVKVTYLCPGAKEGRTQTPDKNLANAKSK